MNEESQVLQLLSQLLHAPVGRPVTLSVASESAHAAVQRLHDAVLERGLVGVLQGTGQRDVLKKRPSQLTDPDDIRYFELYRESYTADQLHVPLSRLNRDGSKPLRSPGWTTAGYVLCM